MTQTTFFHSDKPIVQDRITLRVSAVYAEWDPSNITAVTHSFDRIVERDRVPLQMSVRLSPTVRVPVPYGNTDPSKCRLIFVQNQLKSADEAMRKIGKTNLVSVYDKDDNLLSVLPANEISTFVFPGEVFLETSSVTCDVQVTVFPL
jgi:hypothetical protein